MMCTLIVACTLCYNIRRHIFIYNSEKVCLQHTFCNYFSASTAVLVQVLHI
jgi:hypothetical protein